MQSSSLCHICLRADRDTRALGPALDDFLQGLLNNPANRDSTAQYCLECEHQLRKFYKFKEKCVDAGTILKYWRKTRVADRKPFNTLHKLLPQLSLCKQENVIYVIHTDSVDVTSSTMAPEGIPIKQEIIDEPSEFDDVSIETNSHMQEIKHDENALVNDEKKVNNIIKTTTVEIEIKLEKIDTDVAEHSEYYGENSMVKVKEEPKVKSEDESTDEDEEDEDMSYLSDICLDDDDDVELDDLNKQKRKLRPKSEERHSDASDDDDHASDDDDDYVVPVKKAKGTKLTNLELKNTSIDSGKSIKKRKRSSISANTNPFTIEDLKGKLSNFFTNEVKANDGTIIERDVILNNLDKWPRAMLKVMWNYTKSDPEKLPAYALDILARYQQRFEDKFDDIFEKTYFNSKERVMEEFQKRKTYESYIESPFKCELCYQGFKRKISVETHWKNHHDPSVGDFECELCHIRRKTAVSLTAHNIRVHRGVYRCKLCPLITFYRHSMIKHCDQHLDSLYKCDICKATFKTRERLQFHEKKTHKSQLICEFCAATYVTPEGLDAHRLKHHKNATMPEEGVPCDACNITFVSTYVYEKHRRFTHGEEIKIRRNRDPTKKITYTCRVCKETGDTQRWKLDHMSAEHPGVTLQPLRAKKHICATCGKAFKSPAILKEHQNVHLGVRPLACEECSKRFYSSDTLARHRLLHQPPRRRCEQCGQVFYTSAQLSGHMKNHVGDRPYKCELCPMAFVHLNSLRGHERRRHADPLAPPAAASGDLGQSEAQGTSRMRNKINTNSCGVVATRNK